MRHHARRLLTAAAAAACLGALAAPAPAVEVRIDVTNAAAPTVRIVTPADGARIVAGTAVPVRVEGTEADRMAMAVGPTPTWSGPGNTLAGEWSPRIGTYRLIAVAERAGAPDAVAVSDVHVVAPDEDEGAAPPAAAPPAAPTPPGAAAPGITPTPAIPGPGGSYAPAPGGPGGGAPAIAAPSVRRAAPASATRPSPRVPAPASVTPTAGATPGEQSPVISLIRAIGRILSSPERVAWVVAFPLLLVIAAVAYLLLQRFIDGGPKLAWRGRGRSDDQVIEF